MCIQTEDIIVLYGYIIFNRSAMIYTSYVYYMCSGYRVIVVTGPFVDWCRRWLSPYARVNDIIIYIYYNTHKVGARRVYIHNIILNRNIAIYLHIYVSIIMILLLLSVFYPPQHRDIYLLYDIRPRFYYDITGKQNKKKESYTICILHIYLRVYIYRYEGVARLHSETRQIRGSCDARSISKT